MTRTLITNATIITMDGADGGVRAGDILIEGDTISAIDAAIAAPGAEVIDATDMIVMPGLIDAHLHTWQTGLRAIAGDWSLGEYLANVHVRLAPHFTPEDIYLGNLLGALNQINAGVTALFDWCHNNPTPEHSTRAIDGLAESGIRAVFGHGTPKPDIGPGGVPLTERMHQEGEVRRLAERVEGEALVSQALCILGPDLSSYEASVHDIRLAREHGLIASTHTGGRLPAGRKTPDGMLRLAAEGLLGPDFNAVHSNKLSDGEFDVMVTAGVHFTVTPEVEMQMGHGTPVTGRLLKRGAQPSIGIDIETGIGTDMTWAARFALQLQRGLDNAKVHADGSEIEAVSIPSIRALEWITTEGAAMMGMSGRIGSLVPGKQADLIAIRADDQNLFAAADPMQAVLYHSTSANVDTVMIAGRVMKRAGRLVRGDLDALKERLAESGRRLLADAGLRPR